MLLTGLDKQSFILGREIGRGGEGAVLEIADHPELVFKKYLEPISPEKAEKLRLMAAMYTPELEQYAAWVRDLGFDEYGVMHGFVMKKLSGFVPLHALFSPMDRKRLFPNKGYNFLLHVARNLATAFYRLHESGLAVGDVNEGNILINANGLVAFIDCDSFQVKNDRKTFYCEVGVPRYTPPEFLRLSSFDKKLRTVNTDSFSMAVLIFQLLFLGRHPFAGINVSSMDIDEETAILNGDFAYSLSKKKKRLEPPKFSFDINALNDDVIQLFHDAFETRTRPAPADWIKVLDNQLNNITFCELSKVHSYPEKMQHCPWCEFRRTSGIVFFLDDAYGTPQRVAIDIENFVNGFNLEANAIKNWNNNMLTKPVVTPAAIDSKFYSFKKYVDIGVVVGIGLVLALWLVHPAYSFSLVLVTAYFRRYSGWTKKLEHELKRKQYTYEKIYNILQEKIVHYDALPSRQAHSKTLTALHSLVQTYKDLPNEINKKITETEKTLYFEQLNNYLGYFQIAESTIPAIGTAKKTALVESGIVTAAHISKLNQLKVPGIGPKNTQILIDWQQNLETKFIYIRDDEKMKSLSEIIEREFSQRKTILENAIIKEYQSLVYLTSNINMNLNAMQTQMLEIYLKMHQAYADYLFFRNKVTVRQFLSRREATPVVPF
jgi:DNA-binding helix-hairpin-helix protein with protein kinase domain